MLETVQKDRSNARHTGGNGGFPTGNRRHVARRHPQMHHRDRFHPQEESLVIVKKIGKIGFKHAIGCLSSDELLDAVLLYLLRVNDGGENCCL